MRKIAAVAIVAGVMVGLAPVAQAEPRVDDVFDDVDITYAQDNAYWDCKMWKANPTNFTFMKLGLKAMGEGNLSPEEAAATLAYEVLTTCPEEADAMGRAAEATSSYVS